jgi:hypothetical protein
MMALAGILFPGCGGRSERVTGCSTRADGIVKVTWTVRGDIASRVSCQGISSLAIALTPESCQGNLVISPIPCELGKLRYDTLPRGPAILELVGLDARDRPMVRDAALVELTEEVPDEGIPLDLR